MDVLVAVLSWCTLLFLIPEAFGRPNGPHFRYDRFGPDFTTDAFFRTGGLMTTPLMDWTTVAPKIRPMQKKPLKQVTSRKGASVSKPSQNQTNRKKGSDIAPTKKPSDVYTNNNIKVRLDNVNLRHRLTDSSRKWKPNQQPTRNRNNQWRRGQNMVPDSDLHDMYLDRLERSRSQQNRFQTQGSKPSSRRGRNRNSGFGHDSMSRGAGYTNSRRATSQASRLMKSFWSEYGEELMEMIPQIAFLSHLNGGMTHPGNHVTTTPFPTFPSSSGGTGNRHVAKASPGKRCDMGIQSLFQFFLTGQMCGFDVRTTPFGR